MLAELAHFERGGGAAYEQHRPFAAGDRDAVARPHAVDDIGVERDAGALRQMCVNHATQDAKPASSSCRSSLRPMNTSLLQGATSFHGLSKRASKLMCTP